MQRIQAGTYLHFLHFVYGRSVGEDDAAFVQCGLTVRKSIFNDQVFAFFRIDKGSDIGVFGSNYGIQTADMILGQHSFYFGIRSGGDLVDHAPGEGDFRLVIDVA